jgi:hypothetical protein
MANIIRNDITIEGDNLGRALDAIGFNTRSREGTREYTVFNYERIAPPPKDELPEGWENWYSNNWGSFPYGGAQPGDILERSKTKILFKVYTHCGSAYDMVEKVAKRFPQYSVGVVMWELANSIIGEVRWLKGQERLVVQPYDAQMSYGDHLAALPAPRVTEAQRLKAEELVAAAAKLYEGSEPLVLDDAETIVADVLADSEGDSVAVQFGWHEDGSYCLYVNAG